MNKNKGFTLIELVVVIVILGILSATALPKFINLQSDAHASVVSGTGAAVKSAISLAHTKWLAGGYNGPVDDLDLYGSGTSLMDMNSSGWPAQSWSGTAEANPQLDNTSDCIFVWEAILDGSSPTVATNTSEDFQVTYTANTCTFIYVTQPEYSIFYNSTNGEVVVDTTI
jgi:prepilin-type N-terminal cleavage/methylation domain-containing protein